MVQCCRWRPSRSWHPSAQWVLPVQTSRWDRLAQCYRSDQSDLMDQMAHLDQMGLLLPGFQSFRWLRLDRLGPMDQSFLVLLLDQCAR